MNPEVEKYLREQGVDPTQATGDQIAHAQVIANIRAGKLPEPADFGAPHEETQGEYNWRIEHTPYTEEQRKEDIAAGMEPMVPGLPGVSARKAVVSPEKQAELSKYTPTPAKFDFSNPSAEDVKKNLEVERVRRTSGLTKEGTPKSTEPSAAKPFQPFGGLALDPRLRDLKAPPGATATAGGGPPPTQYTPSPEGGVLPPDEYAFYLRSKVEGDMKPEDLKRLQANIAEYRKWYNNQGLPYRINQATQQGSEAQAGVEQGRLGAQHGLYQEEIASRDAMERRLQDQEHLFAVERQTRAKALDEEMAKYKSGIDAYNKIKIDPEMGFDAMGGRAVASLAAALGFVGAALTGGPNTAVELIKYNVDQSLAAQRANLMKSGNALGMQHTLLGILTDRLGDVDRAEVAARGILFQDLAMKAETEGRKSGDVDVMARAKSIAEELKTNAEKFKLLTSQQLQAEADAKTQAQMSMYASSLAAKRAQEQPRAKAGKLTEAMVKNHVTWQTWEPGKGWVQHQGFARSEGQADRIESMTGHYEAVQRDIQELQSLNGYALPATDKSARANVLVHDMNTHIIMAKQGDAKNITEADFEIAKPYTGGIDPTDLSSFNADALSEQIKRLQNNDIQIHTRGITPGTVQPMINDKGETEWLGTFDAPAEVERKGKPVGEGYTQTNEAPAPPGQVDFSSR